MYRFILKRLIMLIPVLLGVSFIVYTIMSFTPGDPVQMMLGDNYSEEAYAALEEELGLDDPFLVQYGRYVINAVQLDFGTSYDTGNPVAAEIAARLPNTILLSACAMLFAILIGIPLGVISATHQYSAVDNISMVGALFGVSMPNFWLGLMLIVIFAAGLGWFPSSNFETWGALVLPAITLSANSLAMITRMTRSSMLETIRQDYIRTARAKGLKESVITIRHALGGDGVLLARHRPAAGGLHQAEGHPCGGGLCAGAGHHVHHHQPVHRYSVRIPGSPYSGPVQNGKGVSGWLRKSRKTRRNPRRPRSGAA